MMRTILVFAAALLTASPAAADLCNRQWLQQAPGRDVQRHVQATNADVNRVCNTTYRSRPLHLALLSEGVGSDMVEALLNAGADAEHVDVLGDSPRTLADAAREEGRLSGRVHLFRHRFEPAPKPSGRSAIPAGGAASTDWTGRAPSGASRPCCGTKGWTSTWTAAAATGPCTTPCRIR